MKTYNTKDLYLAAFLTAQGFPIHQWIRDAGLTDFAFAETTELSLLQYGNALKNIKSMLHSKNTNIPTRRTM